MLKPLRFYNFPPFWFSILGTVYLGLTFFLYKIYPTSSNILFYTWRLIIFLSLIFLSLLSGIITLLHFGQSPADILLIKKLFRPTVYITSSV
jgi:hypothetical protein